MLPKVIECNEFDEVAVSLPGLFRSGKFLLDERVAGRGYFDVSLKGADLVLRANKYVGLIPLTSDISVHVRPRASLTNLSYMIAKSGTAPTAIPAFSRGYLPRFEASHDLERVYGQSLLLGVEGIVRQGLMKGYHQDANAARWRGRLLVSDTIRKHAAKGIRYRHEFESNILTPAIMENIGLLEALHSVRSSLDKRADVQRLEKLIAHFDRVPRWTGTKQSLVSSIGRQVAVIAPQLSYYREPLWMALVILQQTLPDVGNDGSVALDSLIIDVSKVFEAYTRRVLEDRSASNGWRVRDGNIHSRKFFTDARDYKVQPDMILLDGHKPIAVIDAKYKIKPKESDRYELLAFMDAFDVSNAAFVSPTIDGAKSQYLGVTVGGRRMTSLRFDLAADDPVVEADKLFRNVVDMVDGRTSFA